MSGKPTESGWFWEWRAFGEIHDSILERARRCALRGAPNVENEDWYFVSPFTDQNVKLRADAGLLKLKPLLARLDDGCELYEESLDLLFAMPASPDAVARAAALLGVDLARTESPVDAGRLVAAFASASVETVRVRKRRTQYVVGDGWIEVAELELPAARVTSLGIQSARIEETRRLRDTLDPDRRLSPTSYVDACRRWQR